MHRSVGRSLLFLAAAAGVAVLVGAGCGAGMDSDDLRGISAAELAGGVGKVTICHVPPGNPDNAHTITVGAPGAAAHLRQHDGDFIGPCEPVDAGVPVEEDAGTPITDPGTPIVDPG